MEDVLRALRLRDFEIKKDKKVASSSGEGLQVRGRPVREIIPKAERRETLEVNQEEEETPVLLFTGFARRKFTSVGISHQEGKVKILPLTNLNQQMYQMVMIAMKDSSFQN